jgi:hypothetical protein
MLALHNAQMSDENQQLLKKIAEMEDKQRL